MAFFDARILPLANSASVTPTTASVPITACATMPGHCVSKSTEMPPRNTPWAAE